MLQVCTVYYYTQPMIDMYSTIHIKFSRSTSTISGGKYCPTEICNLLVITYMLFMKPPTYLVLSDIRSIFIAIYSSTLTKLHRVGN